MSELEVQKYLRGGKTLEDLNQELGIKATVHDYLPLVILNYDQINSSPKTHPIVRECRALVLDTQDWSVVARSFQRFFNWGEVQDEMDLFDFSDFLVHSKEDGSLCLLFNYNRTWLGITRGSFAQDKIQFCEITWTEGFAQAMGLRSLSDLELHLDPAYTYVCEFVSPWNKVVRRYAEPKLYLLTIFDGHVELDCDTCDRIVSRVSEFAPLFLRPQRFDFRSMEEIQKYLTAQIKDDPTFEGVVICDRNGLRYKVKNPAYLGLHKMRGESDNLFNPKHLMPFLLNGEDDELLLYFPEVKGVYYEYKSKVLESFVKLAQVWEENYRIESQKDFAIAIQGKTPFTGMLFDLRKKHGQDQRFGHLLEMWRNSSDKILKHVFNK